MTARYARPANGTFGELLRSLREERRLSMAELGRRLGVSHATISRLERGERRPSRLMVLRLGRALAVDDAAMATLLASAGYSFASLEAAPELVELARLLNDPRVPEAARRVVRAAVASLVDGLRNELTSDSAVKRGAS